MTKIAKIEVELGWVEPEVVRTLLVPMDIKMDRLHLVIQAARGWANYHLYEFYSESIRWGEPFEGFEETISAKKTKFGDALKQAESDEIYYMYDFGDSWVHRVKLIETTAPKLDEIYPQLVEISGQCPPEDIGGPPGYEMFLEVTNDPNHADYEDYEELLELYGGTFDPNDPATNILRSNVQKLAKKWQPKLRKK